MEDFLRLYVYLYLLYAADAGWVNGGFYPFERDKACILSGNRMKIHDD